jgi:hypothetical protein
VGLDQGSPELRIRPWMAVVGSPQGWQTFVLTASEEDLAAANRSAGIARPPEPHEEGSPTANQPRQGVRDD